MRLMKQSNPEFTSLFFQPVSGPPGIMVLSLNDTGTQVTEFLMICFPGMQDTQHWLSTVLAPLLVLALGANFVLLLAIWQEASLHEPMYYLLAILSALDLILCLTVIPKVRPALDLLPGTQSNGTLFRCCEQSCTITLGPSQFPDESLLFSRPVISF